MIGSKQQEHPHIVLRSISKWFGSNQALRQVNLEIRRGSIHAVLGENGAGKTTLMGVLFGLIQPDDGQIIVDGGVISIDGPIQARKLRIGMVHQHFKLVPELSVTENIILGQEPTKGPFIDMRSAEHAIRSQSERYGLNVDPRSKVGDLSVGVRQRVEILKALSYDADTIIFDEPTAVLAPQEAEALFEIMRNLRSMDRAIIFVTHRLKELRGLADTITVMRRGEVVTTLKALQAAEQDLASLMLGRTLNAETSDVNNLPGTMVFAARGLSGPLGGEKLAVRKVSLEVHEREIVGVAGVEGNGQAELAELIAGLNHATAGSIELSGKSMDKLSPLRRRRLGLAYIPEDRLEVGTSINATVADNLVAGQYEAVINKRTLLLDTRAVRKRAADLIYKYDIRGAVPETLVRYLSGGNIQKIVLARELEAYPTFLLATQPTRGLDIGATEFVHAALIAQKTRGCAILLISADLDEVLALSDRIVVMFKGEIVGEVDKQHVNIDQIGRYMMGIERMPREVFSA